MQEQVLGQPTFANALKLFPKISRNKSYLKMVRVRDGVASITDGKILLRRSMLVPDEQKPGFMRAAMPDGAYDVKIGGALVPTYRSDWMKYPDIDLIKPRNFEDLKPLCTINNEMIGMFIEYLEEVKKHDGTIVIDNAGIWMIQNKTFGIAFPFNIGMPISLDPELLQVVFIELTRYPHVFMTREFRPADEDKQITPLIFGLNWLHCGLIMPLTGWEADND